MLQLATLNKQPSTTCQINCESLSYFYSMYLYLSCPPIYFIAKTKATGCKENLVYSNPFFSSPLQTLSSPSTPQQFLRLTASFSYLFPSHHLSLSSSLYHPPFLTFTSSFKCSKPIFPIKTYSTSAFASRAHQRLHGPLSYQQQAFWDIRVLGSLRAISTPLLPSLPAFC